MEPIRKVGIISKPDVAKAREVVPELFPNRFTPELVSEAAMKLMDDAWLQSRIRGNYETLRRPLGGGKVAERVARAVAGAVQLGP